jgi:hypothetical protein
MPRSVTSPGLPRLVLLPILLLAACSGSASDDPGAVTPDEAAQLNDAAAMLDANSIDLDAVTANTTDTAP